MALESRTNVDEITKVKSSEGRPVTPASDADDHAGGTGDPSAGVSETMEVPDAAETVTILANEADDSFAVKVSFANTKVSYSGDSTSPVDVERAVVSPELTITFSGAATTVDYDIFVR